MRKRFGVVRASASQARGLLLGFLLMCPVSAGTALAQDCADSSTAAKIARLQQQLGRTANPQAGLEYQLAQAQVDLESARAREFTSKSKENTIAVQKAESKVKGLDATVKRLDAEIKRIAALPNCGPGRTTRPGAPPVQRQKFHDPRESALAQGGS